MVQVRDDTGDHCGLYFCPNCGTVQRHTELTRAELEVLRAYAEGMTTAEIADLRFVSRKTVDWQRGNILLKLGAPTITAAVVRGIKDRLIILEDV